MKVWEWMSRKTYRTPRNFCESVTDRSYASLRGPDFDVMQIESRAFPKWDCGLAKAPQVHDQPRGSS
jgi:hypothetical protein